MYNCTQREEDQEKSEISSINERKDYNKWAKAGWAEKYLQENRSHGKAD